MPLCIAVVVLALAACGRPPASPTGADAGGSGANVVDTQATVPDEQANEFADIATNPSDLRSAWTRFRLKGEPPATDFDQSTLLFVAFGESGSCPSRFDNLSVDDDIVNVEFGIEGFGSDEEVACTDDYNPRTFVLEVERNELPDGEFELKLDGDRSFTLSGVQTAAPPMKPSVVGLGTDERPNLKLRIRPRSAEQGEARMLRISNAGDVSAGTGDSFSLLRWDSQRWVQVADQPKYRDHPAITSQVFTVRAGDTEDVASVVTGDLKPGWYAVFTKLQLGGRGGVAEIQAPFEVTAAPSHKTGEQSAEGDLKAPPKALLAFDEGTVETDAYTYCWSSGGAGMCADGVPMESSPTVTVSTGSSGTLRFRPSAAPTTYNLAASRGLSSNKYREIPVSSDGTFELQLKPGDWYLSLHTEWPQGDAAYSGAIRVTQ